MRGEAYNSWCSFTDRHFFRLVCTIYLFCRFPSLLASSCRFLVSFSPPALPLDDVTTAPASHVIHPRCCVIGGSSRDVIRGGRRHKGPGTLRRVYSSFEAVGRIVLFIAFTCLDNNNNNKKISNRSKYLYYNIYVTVERKASSVPHYFNVL